MASDPLLIQIRERSFLDLLDLGLVVVRSHPRAIGLAAAGGCLPFAALNAWLASRGDLPGLLFFFLILMELPWATAPLTVVLGALMFGERPGVRRVAVSLLRGLPALVFFQVFLRGVLLLTVVFSPVIPYRYAFLNEVILLERGRFVTVSKRCGSLASDRGGDLFGQALALVFFGALFVASFWFGTSRLTAAWTAPDLTWDAPGASDLSGLRTQAAFWMAVSFAAVARFLTYIDQRIRLEGWEVKLRLQGVGKALEGGRW